MSLVSLFSGIGGLELGLERAGWGPTLVQAESAEFPLRLLEKHWPAARRVTDVALVDGPIGVTMVCGGFPCQPVSAAGLKLAQDDERWLWPAFATVIERLQPRFVVAENVDGLRKRGLHDVLADLARLGYDAEWDLIPAATIGAPHLRERFFIVAWQQEEPVGLVFDGAPTVSSWWVDNEEVLPRLQAGVPERKPRLTALGNAVVPAVSEHIGHCLMVAVGGAFTPEHDVPLERFLLRETEVVEQGALFGDAKEVTVGDEGAGLPWAGRMTAGRVAELPRSAPTPKMRLWPTPAAQEAEWGIDAIAATVDKNGDPAADPHARLYHRETGQIVQRGLPTYTAGVEAGLWPEPPDLPLLPTPQAVDGEGGRIDTQIGGTRPSGARRTGTTLRTAAQLLPTPTSSDAIGSRRATARTDEWTSNPGTTLTDAVWMEEGVDHAEVHGRNGATGELLLPTPQATDWKGADLARSENRTGRRHSGDDLPTAARRADKADKLLPTPAATDHKGVAKPGQRRGQLHEAVAFGDEDGEQVPLWPTPRVAADRSSRKSMVDNQQWSAPSLGQAVELAEGHLPREFETEAELNSTARRFWPTPHGISGGAPDGGYDGHGNELSMAVRVVEGVSDSERSAAKLGLIPTPKASPSGPDYARAERPESGGDDLATYAAREATTPAPLNPSWVEWLMGFPPGWTVPAAE